MEFKIDDEVVMNEKAVRYVHTKPGSTGKVVRISEYEVEIQFDKITGAPCSSKLAVFSVDKETVDLAKIGNLKDEIKFAIKKLNNA